MMDPLTLQRIAECVGGELSGRIDEPVRRVITDSRQARPGDLFVALAGPRYDGHAFMAPAFAQGAVAALGESGRFPSSPSPKAVVTVENSRVALGRLATAYRRTFGGAVVAVAGSNGKTTEKEILAKVLGRRWATLASEASFNNDIGVPLTLLSLERRHGVAVIEAGTNHPGELAPLLRMIQPQYGVLTSLGGEHLEFFGDLAGVVQEEGCLAEAIAPSGRLFVNTDAPGIEAVVRRARAAVVRVGWGRQADWRVREAVVDATGSWFALRSPSPEFSREYWLPLLGVHQVVHAALALAVAAELGMTAEEAALGLADCRPAARRLQPRQFGDLTVIDDCYNANLDSMTAALATLRDIAGGRRTVAVLGGMAELGDRSEGDHAAVGVEAAASGLGLLVTVGPQGHGLARAARAAGLGDVQEWEDVREAGARLPDLLRAGDVVLVKASRAARLERIIEALASRLAPAAGNPMELAQ